MKSFNVGFAEVPLENLHLNDINTNLINILQRVLDNIVAAVENSDVEPPHHIILLKMFQCLELLYNNITLTQEQATLVHNWLYGYCNVHEVKGVENTIVHKLLFTQRVRTQKGPIFEGIAKQIQILMDPIEEVRENENWQVCLSPGKSFVCFFYLGIVNFRNKSKMLKN